ncbi:uncharacterized protein LOC108594663 [Drosophila busckii]|uniref:uncharacterized protein LOC108594663 n=1 Tax=Drosophila busckii TaxID=30019 RepID=UPI001432F58F|nr:uncharacterized protein LOC108594663 [Drosophila busckii]
MRVGFDFMAYGFDCCHRSIDFPLMPRDWHNPKKKIKVKLQSRDAATSSCSSTNGTGSGSC